jgi:hypothetical protein
VRLRNTISFSISQGANAPLSNISSWILSTYSKPYNNDVHTFYTEPLIGSTVLVTNAKNPSNWAIYLWNSSTQIALEPLFYDIGLTYISGSGDLIDEEDYLISLLRYDTEENDDKNFVFTQATSSSVWVVEHNLNKYCSVSVVDTGGTMVYGSVEYDSLNKITITFSAPFSGQAFFN